MTNQHFIIVLIVISLSIFSGIWCFASIGGPISIGMGVFNIIAALLNIQGSIKKL
jgi:hypothetical protein